MTDELRAKFEAWYPNAIGDVQPFECYVQGYASRDAEVEALRKDAEIGRYVLKYAAWIRDGDDTLMEIRFAGHVDLSSVGARRDAIDAAMAKESGK